MARRIERKSELNDVHLFLPDFDGKAVREVIKALQSSEDVPPTEAADANELVTLKRRSGTEAIFEAMQRLVTYRVTAHRAQSNIRRYQEIARRLSIDGIDEAIWDAAKENAVRWIGEQVSLLRASGQFERDRKALMNVTLNTIAVQGTTGTTGLDEDGANYVIEASDLDIDRQFQEAGRTMGNGLHQEYWKRHEGRDGVEVKLELIIVARAGAARLALEDQSKEEFNSLYDRYRADIGRLREHQRKAYERLRSASTTPEPIDWRLQDTIDFRRDAKDPAWESHLFVENDGAFRAELGNWEAGVLGEELKQTECVGWLRNLDRKAWSLEVPYQSAGIARPMFPDMVIVRKYGVRFRFDILEPHDPSLADNLEKAQGLAIFAEKHGDVFDRIQLIRKQATGFARLELNKSAIRDKLRLVTANAQIDDLFASDASFM